MRVRMRLMSAMLAIALVAVLLAVMAREWERRDAAQRHQYALLATDRAYEPQQWSLSVQFLSKHGEHGSSCLVCKERTRPLDEMIAEAEKRLRAARQNAEKYTRLAGPDAFKAAYFKITM